MWLYCCGDDKPGKDTNIVLFDYHNSRAAHCVVGFLDGYQGYMHVDGYKAYEQTKATLVACLAHIRRKFIEAKGNNKKTVKADVALNLIRKLYGIEQAIKGNRSVKNSPLGSKKPNQSLMNCINGYSNTKIKSLPKWR